MIEREPEPADRLTRHEVTPYTGGRGHLMSEGFATPESERLEAERVAETIIRRRTNIAERTRERFAGPTALPEWVGVVARIEAAPNDDSRKEIIKDYLRGVNPSSREGVATPILNWAAEYDETLDYLINKIVVPPLDAETGEYQLGLYALSTLEEIKEILKTNAERDPASKLRYQRALGIIEAARLFHQMNKLMVIGQIKGFVDGAQVITPEQLQTLQDVPGVAQIMRLFDEELSRYTAKDDYIKNGENYDILMGTKRNRETGERELVKFRSIEAQLKELIEAERRLGLDMGGLSELEPWEINWAFLAGRILTNISLRSSEIMSLGKPKGSDEGYASRPLESAQALVDWMELRGLRFSISEVRYGVKLAEMTRAIFHRDRKKQGYGEIRLKKVAGKDVKDVEDTGLFGVGGVWTSWRQNRILLKNGPIREVRMRISSGRGVGETREMVVNTLRDLVDIGEIERVRKEDLERLGLSKNEAAKRARQEQLSVLHGAYLDEHGNLREEINAYLGALMRHGSLTPKETDQLDVIELKQEIRTKIWERVAQDNPLAIIPFLIETEFEGRAPAGYVDLTEILRGVRDGADNPLFSSLRWKLRIAHERRITAIKNREANTSLDRFLIENAERVEELVLTVEEQRLLERIRNNGRILAPDLAAIRLPFNPFMNDVIFEKADYSDGGAEFFRRRMAGDIGSFYGAQEGFTKLMDNPGKQSWDDIKKVLIDMVQGIGIPLSIDTGQDKVAPFTEAILTMLSRGSQIEDDPKSGPFRKAVNGVRRWIAKDELFNFIKEKTNRPNSLLQEKSGEKALAFGEFQLKEAIDDLLHEGVVRRKFIKDGLVAATDLYWEFRKKFKTKLGWLILAFIRSMLPVFALGAFVETGKRTYQGK